MSGFRTSILHVNLAERPDSVEGTGAAALMIFWWNSLPLAIRGFEAAELPLDKPTLDQLSADFGASQLAARRGSGEWLDENLGAISPLALLDELSKPSPASAEQVTVIVCTRDRPDDLAQCLDHLVALAPAPGEIIVVDNSDHGSAREIVERHPSVRWLHEPRKGLSIARNAGIAAAKTDLIAFTDDDCFPTSHWAGEIAAAMKDRSVDAVTGLVLPASLETESQHHFQFTLNGFDHGCLPRAFGADYVRRGQDDAPPVWRIGAGANMAFRREVFFRCGVFDERLGAGASGCSEDSEMWNRILMLGGRIAYEPRLAVAHKHREDEEGLYSQTQAYLRGHVTALIAQHDMFGPRSNLKRALVSLPLYLVGGTLRTLVEGHRDRRSLLGAEAKGWAQGVTYLMRSGWRKRVPVVPHLEKLRD